jgi:hypothetical protein
MLAESVDSESSAFGEPPDDVLWIHTRHLWHDDGKAGETFGTYEPADSVSERLDLCRRLGLDLAEA